MAPSTMFSMENSNSKETVVSYSEALARIASIEQQAQVMGANDYEPSAFNRLREELEQGSLTPTEAVRRAQAILDSKQDYH